MTTAPAGSALVNETFENKTSGWPDRADPIGKVGYHAPSWYHVEVARARASTIALGGFNMSDVVVETAVHVDKTDTPSGQFRYGIVVRAHGAPRAGPLAGVGNARPENYYAFVVDPRAGQWLLLHEDNRPQRVRASGALPKPLRTTDPANPDVLRVEMQGSVLNFAVNGEEVTTFNTQGYHLDGDIGFYVDTLEETKAHVHFDRLTITAQ